MPGGGLGVRGGVVGVSGALQLGAHPGREAFDPPEMLTTDLAIFHCLISPRLATRSVEVEQVRDGVHRVQLVLENTGWLPTNVTETYGWGL